jgi:hypothetical protein
MTSDPWFLLSDPYTWITLLDYTLGAIFVSQLGVAIAVFFGANLVVYYYDLGHSKNPEALREKVFNLLDYLFLWFPVYLYKRMSSFPFLIRNCCMLFLRLLGQRYTALYGWCCATY